MVVFLILSVVVGAVLLWLLTLRRTTTNTTTTTTPTAPPSVSAATLADAKPAAGKAVKAPRAMAGRKGPAMDALHESALKGHTDEVTDVCFVGTGRTKVDWS